jgi:MFS transporter, PPP family, 3-phenylpropionic acid transporter
VAIGVYYFTYLAAIGVFLPFVSLYLKSLGLPPAEVTRLMALGPLASLLVPPLAGLIADLGRARVWLLRFGTLATALVSVGFLGRPGRWALAATLVGFALFRAPLLSLVDATALDRGRYGRLRLWGSAGFLVAVLGSGWLHDRLGAGRGRVGDTAALAASVLAAFALPAPPLEPRPRILSEWRKLLAQPGLWLFLLAVLLVQSAGAVYDGAFSLHLQRLGFDGRFVALAWAVGVGAEVALMWISPALLLRFRPEWLFFAGAATAAVRWLCLGRVHGRLAILLLQPLHAVTFGLCYVAAVHVMRGRGAATPTAAQGLYAMAMMLGSLAGMSAAGWLLERLGGQGMFATASVVALLGAGCALAHADLS